MSNVASQRTVTVNNENGLHLVPCSLIARLSREYDDCDVRIRKETLDVDAKNVLELMTLNAGQGTSLELSATGDRSEEAIERLVAIFDSNFEVDESPEHTT